MLFRSIPAYCAAKWDGKAWAGLALGLNNAVNALAVDNSGNLYVGGSFATTPDGNRVNNVAKWDGTAWSPLGSGVSGAIYGCVLDDAGGLYVGGDFSVAGGGSANCVARWNGRGWASLGSGLNNPVHSLVLDRSGNLYAGGDFTTAGGVRASFVAKWDGHAWSPLGELHNKLTALALDNETGTLCAGGFLPVLSSRFGAPFGNKHVAAWNGSYWYPLPDLGDHVYALLVGSSQTLYAGCGTVLAQLEDSGWSGLRIYGSPQSEFGPAIDAIIEDCSGRLYIGGAFLALDGIGANSIAVRSGDRWSALGSGLNGQVRALALSPSGKLYVAGTFTTAGAKVSPFLAEADVTALDVPTLACPTNQTVEFNSAAGSVAFFTPTLSVSCFGSVEIVCVPPSGSTFPIGTNMVRCTATNSAGNGSQCEFTVTVLGPRQVKNCETSMFAVVGPVALFVGNGSDGAFADLLVVSKADLPGAQTTARQLRDMLSDYVRSGGDAPLEGGK